MDSMAVDTSIGSRKVCLLSLLKVSLYAIQNDERYGTAASDAGFGQQ